MKLQIEITNICNFDCVYCPRPFLKRGPSFITSNTVSKIMESFASDIDGIILNKDGEIFLHPKCDDILRLVYQYEKEIRIPTNAEFLTPEIVECLNQSPKRVKMIITEHILGRTKSQCERVKTKVRNNINCLFHMKKQHIDVVILKHFIDGFENELDEFNDYYKKLNLKYGFTMKVNREIDRWCDFVHLNSNKKRKKCVYGNGSIIVFGVTGNMLLCCTDLNEECVIGNIEKDTKEKMMKDRSRLFGLINCGDWKDICPCNRCLI